MKTLDKNDIAKMTLVHLFTIQDDIKIEMISRCESFTYEVILPTDHEDLIIRVMGPYDLLVNKLLMDYYLTQILRLYNYKKLEVTTIPSKKGYIYNDYSI